MSEKSPQMALALNLRDEAMARVADHAGEPFGVQAANFILRYLRESGESPGEDITDAAKEAGIVPHDDRAFGPAYLKLYKGGHIKIAGHIPRRKGHGAPGGRIWDLAKTEND